MSTQDTDAIWNRALDLESPADAEFAGDAALHRVLVFHGSVQNGGLLATVENHLDDEEYPLTDIIDAFNLLGDERLVALLESVESEISELRAADDEAAWEEAEFRIDDRYPYVEDRDLEQQVEIAYRTQPDQFAPA